jgi:hypothetical protein
MLLSWPGSWARLILTLNKGILGLVDKNSNNRKDEQEEYITRDTGNTEEINRSLTYFIRNDVR